MIARQLFFLFVLFSGTLPAQPQPDSLKILAHKIRSVDVRWVEKGKTDTSRQMYTYDTLAGQMALVIDKPDFHSAGQFYYHPGRRFDYSFFLKNAKNEKDGWDSGSYRFVIKYDALNRPVMAVSHNLRGTDRKGWDTVSRIMRYMIYNADGKYTGDSMRYSNYPALGKNSIAYDSLGRQTSYRHLYDGKLQYANAYRYDSLNRKILEQEYDKKSWLKSEDHFVYTGKDFAAQPYTPVKYPATRTVSGLLTYHFLSSENIDLRSETYSFLPGGVKELDETHTWSMERYKDGLWKTLTEKKVDKKGKTTITVYQYRYTFF